MEKSNLTLSDPDEPASLVLHMEMPNSVDEDEFIKLLTELIVSMSRYHISLGGSGLKLDDVKIWTTK